MQHLSLQIICLQVILDSVLDLRFIFRDVLFSDLHFFCNQNNCFSFVLRVSTDGFLKGRKIVMKRRRVFLVVRFVQYAPALPQSTFKLCKFCPNLYFKGLLKAHFKMLKTKTQAIVYRIFTPIGKRNFNVDYSKVQDGYEQKKSAESIS